MLPWLGKTDPFPPVEFALRDPNGLLAVGGDLSPERLLDAYSRGIFPWFSEGDPLLWWSPDPRMVLRVEELRVSRSLRKVLRSRRYHVTFDTAFAEVMAGCASPRRDQEGTWITPAMMAAYTDLARLGFAHSAEAWHEGQLVGGLYGIALGRMFFGESMFASRPDASKVAFVVLVRHLHRWGFPLVDCQMSTAHLVTLGARDVPRSDFFAEVQSLSRQPAHPSPWTREDDVMGASE